MLSTLMLHAGPLDVYFAGSLEQAQLVTFIIRNEGHGPDAIAVPSDELVPSSLFSLQ